MVYNSEKICRVCLGEGELETLFSEAGTSPSTMIMLCTQIEISASDGLPSVICSSCMYRLCIAFDFKQLCEKSDQKLRGSLISSPINDDNIKREKETIENDEEDGNIYDVPDNVCEMILNENNFDIGNLENPSNNSICKNNLVTGNFKQIDEYPNKIKYNRKRYKPTKKSHVCTECNKAFTCSNYLIAHIRTHTGERPFECEICQKKFTQLVSLSMHLRTHTGEKPFQCEICSKRFATSSNLYAHHKTHSSEKNFLCTMCSRTFKTSDGLQRHAVKHTGVKPHICTICNKGFYSRTYLNTHINTVHYRIKKYKCSQCDKDFANSSALNVHKRIHTGEKPYSCIYCKSEFNHSSAVKRHIKNLHLSIKKKKNRNKIT